MVLELEIANVGNTPATLIKLEDIATNGLEVDREKSQLRVTDNYLDMRGKRLEYLKTHEVKIHTEHQNIGAALGSFENLFENYRIHLFLGLHNPSG